jgi:hypothetical protein
MNNWIKHDLSKVRPEEIDSEAMIEVETFASMGNIFALARELNWAAVKFYRIAHENSVEKERHRIKAELEAPRKDFSVMTNAQVQSVDGYQAACQRATDLYKEGQEPMIVIRYSKPDAPTVIGGGNTL